ncbi:MAG: family 2 glycosyl transferase [Betaproteobacteria bacterium RIFCSPHIGHO2_12_FULL_69_13]|nr:MAG: family 2 glycosyl transferase [Betaproteobacteria bacterium RIFCSPHIGHO2_12_FULL_69_13]
MKLTVCLLTFDSQRLLREVIPPLLELADELVVVDSGSSDDTLAICAAFGLAPIHRPYRTHADQMNHAVSLARNDWVLCIDSDEVLDARTVAGLRGLKAGPEPEAGTAFRLSRHWHVLGREVHAIYPVSSPDYPVRLFNRSRVRFNDAPVDDKAVGFARTEILPGRVRHDTFRTLGEMQQKLDAYTSRRVRYSRVSPSLARAAAGGVLAFLKWYFRKGGWRDGLVGLAAGAYAAAYTFLKYFKSWQSARRRS